jgi:hypothetical protein
MSLATNTNIHNKHRNANINSYFTFDANKMLSDHLNPKVELIEPITKKVPNINLSSFKTIGAPTTSKPVFHEIASV